MPGGLSRLLIRAFVHRPFRNGNDRWRRGDGTSTHAVKGTEKREFSSADTRFLYLFGNRDSLPTDFSNFCIVDSFLSLSLSRVDDFRRSNLR